MIEQTTKAEERHFRKVLSRNVLMPLFLSLLSGSSFVAIVMFLMNTSQWLEHTEQVISEASQLFKLNIDAETSLRGYLLTRDEEFLEPQNKARAEIPTRIVHLRKLVSDNPAQVERVNQMGEQFRAWLEFSDRRRTSTGTDQRELLENARRGKAMMDQIRATYAAFLESEEVLRASRQKSSLETTRMTLALIVFLSLGVGAFLALFGRKQLFALSHRYSEILRKQLEQTRELETQAWLANGYARLQDEFKGNPSVSEVCEKSLQSLARYLGAEVGRIFLMADDKTLRVCSNYAFDERVSKAPARFELGQGSVGQCALEKQTVRLTSLPDDYLHVSSSLGSVTISQSVTAPILLNRELKGVVELGFRNAPTAVAERLLGEATERIAYAINSAQYREQVQDLLEETQRQSEELQTQQEELERNNEDLQQKTQEVLAQQHNLEQANAELEQQQTLLEEQKQRLEEANHELHHSQRAIKETAEGLELANRYKSEFLANMSHELRTPLNSILLLANLLFENSRSALNQEEVEYATTIHASATDLLNLINDILDLSKVEAGKLDLNPDHVAMRDLAESAQRMFAAQMKKKGLTFRTEFTEDVAPYVITDKIRTEQILRNLLSNALKFTETGEVEVLFRKPETQFAQYAVAIAVRDTGIGIAADKQRLVFEAFNQADGTIGRKFGGTGLGLTISKELAALLGGTLTLASEEGRGSTFTLYLPHELAQPPSENETAAEGTGLVEPPVAIPVDREGGNAHGIVDDRRDLKPNDRCILVIEDDPTFAKFLFSLCQKKGFKCLLAENGEAGVEDAFAFVPTAIILDINLPGLSGLGVLDQLKRHAATRHIPVHALSVEDRAKDVLRLGAIGFEPKPASRETLERVLDRLTRETARATKKLLLVEDNPIEQQNLKRVIGDGDVETTAVSNGRDALEEITREQFDCIILDLKLPDISGFDIIAQLKETKNAHTPIIVYTARELTKADQEKLSEYSNSIVIKGVRSPERLLDEVTLFLHRIEDKLSPAQKEMLLKVRHREEIFQDKDILLVDDDMRNIFALRSVLLKKGFRVHIAKDGQEALEQLAKLPNVHIVLMDIMMPGMDGYETMRKIRKEARFKSLPIVALTAKAMKGDKEKCLAAGASDYLSKPVDMNSLLSLLRIWLTR